MPQCVGLCSSHRVARRNAELELILSPGCFRFLWIVVGDFGGRWKSKQGEIAAIIDWDRAQRRILRVTMLLYWEGKLSLILLVHVSVVEEGHLCRYPLQPRLQTLPPHTKWFLLGLLGMWLNTGITWGPLQQDSLLPLPPNMDSDIATLNYIYRFLLSHGIHWIEPSLDVGNFCRLLWCMIISCVTNCTWI